MSTWSGAATIEPGEVISLAQRSARRREYDLRSGLRTLGTLRWRAG